MKKIYYLNHAPIEFYFRQSVRDFVVDEIPLYEFSGDGEHLVLHIRKKNLTTWAMIDIIANHLGIRRGDIGYAGLKDKNAQTKQYISIHKKYEEQLESLEHDDIKILSKTYHNNKIKIGHLKGNRFFIRLKKVNPTSAKMITEAIKNIKRYGLPNYFGYQRFGNDGENYLKGKAIIEGSLREKNRKLHQFYINSYQSFLFNNWLSKRIEISKMIESFTISELEKILDIPTDEIEAMKAQKHPFKLMSGDVMMHYPYGKIFHYVDGESERFSSRDISPTGLLSGKKSTRSIESARAIESEFDDLELTSVDGSRRYGWIFAEDIEYNYRESEAWYELHFTLPKGSYATTLIEEIAHKQINIEEVD